CGTNKLIRKGAAAITCPEDLHELLGFETDWKGASSNLSINPYNECSKEEVDVIEVLYEPKTRDQISEQLRIPIGRLQVVLSILEIRGIIHEAYGTVALRYPPPSAILRKNENTS
ncbi:MAG: hypothetical protein V4664_00770, partial [Patescibacteria group bacterium]